jgi:hypothetical protein
MIATLASELFKNSSKSVKLSFGCPILGYFHIKKYLPMFIFKYLDKTSGGLSIDGITEISGEAGCGKSQICLTLALQVSIKQS